MDLTASASLPAGPEAVAAWIEDLGTYPSWLAIVAAARPDEGRAHEAGPAWLVELGARVGPLRRTKRVRMVRVIRTARHIRFERQEGDGRDHGAWVLDADLTDASGPTDRPGRPGTELAMALHYSARSGLGSAWMGLLEPVLRQEMGRAGGRLARRMAERPAGPDRHEV